MDSNISPMATVILAMFTIFTVTFALDMPIISCGSWRSDDEVISMYKEWLVKYGKLNNSLGVSENDKRFKIFKDNLRFIDQHNSENRTYKVGLNQFADLSNEEYKAIYLGARFEEKTMGRTKTRISNRYAASATVADNLPQHVDWRLQGAVLPVKDQGRCGNFYSYTNRSNSLQSCILFCVVIWFYVSPSFTILFFIYFKLNIWFSRKGRRRDNLEFGCEVMVKSA
jgi:hypothetical protein